LCTQYYYASQTTFSSQEYILEVDPGEFVLIEFGEFDMESIMIYGSWHRKHGKKDLTKWPLMKTDKSMIPALIRSSKGDVTAINRLNPRAAPPPAEGHAPPAEGHASTL
jgi:hypothetical protein